MATVTKRLRYEILRRDNHACRYCGAKAPEVKLVVDAVTPEALGGSHKDPANLVTACEPCNSGKTSTSPDAPLVADVAQDALRWSKAIAVAAAEMLGRTIELSEAQRQFAAAWGDWTCGAAKAPVPKPPDWRNSVDRFQAAGLPTPVLLECIQIAMARDRVKVADKFRYMCGIAWEKVTELQKRARQVAGQDSAGDEEDELSPEAQAGRADLACELLGYLPMSEIDRYKAEARDRWADTDDDQNVSAIHIAWTEVRGDRDWLQGDVIDLLHALPDGIGADSMRQARTELYDEYGADFSKATFSARAASAATKELNYRDAAAYLDGLPADARAEWIANAIAIFADPDKPPPAVSKHQITEAAAVARWVEQGGSWKRMCAGPGQHTKACPELGAYRALVNEFECCGTPEHKGHLFCERHLEMLMDGSYKSRSGRVITVKDFSVVPATEKVAPF